MNIFIYYTIEDWYKEGQPHHVLRSHSHWTVVKNVSFGNVEIITSYIL